MTSKTVIITSLTIAIPAFLFAAAVAIHRMLQSSEPWETFAVAAFCIGLFALLPLIFHLLDRR